MLPVKNSYRLDEVATFLCLSLRTVYRMVRDGRITAVKLKRGPWRIPRESLEVAIKPIKNHDQTDDLKIDVLEVECNSPVVFNLPNGRRARCRSLR
jgi:excisionase family DNA binding protein